MGIQGDGQRWARSAPIVVTGAEMVGYHGVRGWLARHFVALVGGLALAILVVAVALALV